MPKSHTCADVTYVWQTNENRANPWQSSCLGFLVHVFTKTWIKFIKLIQSIKNKIHKNNKIRTIYSIWPVMDNTRTDRHVRARKRPIRLPYVGNEDENRLYKCAISHNDFSLNFPFHAQSHLRDLFKGVSPITVIITAVGTACLSFPFSLFLT